MTAGNFKTDLIFQKKEFRIYTDLHFSTSMEFTDVAKSCMNILHAVSE